MEFIKLYQEFGKRVMEKSDINEHLVTLMQISSHCESVLELGVRDVVSSYAFALGLRLNNSKNKKLIMNDINFVDTKEFEQLCKINDIDASFIHCNDLELNVENMDLVFIDTWHVYGQLKRELAKFKSVAKKYMVLHDTEEFHICSESVKCRFDMEEQSKQTGFTIEEIRKGLWYAVEEFLTENKDWKLHAHFTNNNGLTILERI